MTDSQLQPNTEPVAPCPTCSEGWRPIYKEHCAECYEGQIASLRAKVDELTAALGDCREFVASMVKPAKYQKSYTISSYHPCHALIDKIDKALAIHSQHSDGEAGR